MKRYYSIYIIISFFLLVFTGCTKDFEQTNIDPTRITEAPNEALLTRSLLDVSGGEHEAWRGNLIYTTQFVQQFASTAWPQGDKYFYDEGYSAALWERYFDAAVKGLVNLVDQTTGDPEAINVNSVARISKAFVFQRLTDLYGDMPYFEAGKGVISGIITPKYDAQQAIYNDLLQELDQAAAALDASKPLKGDIVYNGDVSLWKKAAYSLMLRVAMRLTKIDAATAKTWAAKAVAGGVFSSYTQSFLIPHLVGQYDNPNSHVLGVYNGSRMQLGQNTFKFSKTFYDILNLRKDPRLGILFVIRNNDANTEDGKPALQKGLPNGTDPAAIPAPLSTYSQLRTDFVKADAPNILVSHAQTKLLQAEAVERGYASGDAKALFAEGVQSALLQWKLYNPPAGLINDADLMAYANSLPYTGTTDEKIAAINTQYYIVSLLDGYESFANWRRTNVPTLTPVNYPGNYTGGVIPHRLQWPATESGLNDANLAEATSRQGPNNFVTHVWWDK